MAFDPAKPAVDSPLDAAEVCNQFNALKALIDAQQATINPQQARIAALEAAINGRAPKPTMGEFDPGFSDPPTLADVQNIQTVINDLIDQLANG